MKVGDVWRSHLSLTEEWKAAGRLAPNPQDCPGQMVVTDNDGTRPVMFECDGCGLVMAVRQAGAGPTPSVGRVDDDIPL